MPFLDESARELIDAYNRDPAGQAFNLVAEEVYKARRALGEPLSAEYLTHILTGLIGFDMGRTMQGGSAAFAMRLQRPFRPMERLLD